jgi:2-aminoadipate transaminase
MYAMSETAAVVRGLFSSMTDPDLISFSGGAPAKEALPVDIIREISNDVLRVDSRGIEALQYGPVMGVRDLREVVVDQLLAPKGVSTDADHVLITTGGLESISLTCQVFIDPGDVILVERPTFVHAVETFELFEAKCIGVDMDEDGMDTEDLENKIKLYRPKMIYVIPTFQNPTGRTLSLERRRKIAELAAAYDVVVMEDDPYRDIRYSGTDLPPIKTFDTSGNVVLCNSFSKIFSAGSRIGYVIGNDEVMDRLQTAKTATNSHSSMLPQILCAEFFKRGYFGEHHRMLCDLYRERRDAMMACLDEYFPEGTEHTFPDGGLFTWAVLPGGLNTTELLREATTRPDVKVAYVAGEKFFTDGAPVRNCMRISFGNVSPERIRIGTERLGRMFRSKL